MILKCLICYNSDIEKGRAMDGRRAYRCNQCKAIWTAGRQKRKLRYSNQRQGFQFRDEKKVLPRESKET